MRKTIISIIVPVYNVPNKLLQQCFKSLQLQNIKDVEYIIIDDGSTDHSGLVCDEFEKKDSRFKIVHKPNGGLSSARNTGFDLVTGEWFMFLDSDDYLEVNALYELATQAKKANNVDVICFGTIRRLKKKSFKYNYDNKLKDLQIYNYKTMEKLVLDFKMQLGDATAKLIKTSYAKKNQIYHDIDVKQGVEGLIYCFDLFRKGANTLFIDNYYYNYVYNEKSITINDNDANQKYTFAGFEKLKKIIIENNMSQDILDMYYNRILYIIVGAAISVYFSPKNSEKYKTKKKKFNNYLSNEIIQDALNNSNLKVLDYQRRIIIKLIQRKIFWPILILAKIREIQKEN